MKDRTTLEGSRAKPAFPFDLDSTLGDNQSNEDPHCVKPFDNKGVPYNTRRP
jgi:hypothetical protein